MKLINDPRLNKQFLVSLTILRRYRDEGNSVLCIEILIRNLPNLSHLFIRRCETDIKLVFLQNIIKESPSSCLKINHLEGIITWKNGRTEFKKHPNDHVDPTRHLYGMNPN